jgi:dTDP-4-dehydrorhamnose reductase
MNNRLPRVLLFGNRGQVGSEFSRLLLDGGYPFVGVDRDECDVSSSVAVRDLIRQTEPQVIVNASAYTAVDRAEAEPESAKAINATAPMIMAEEAKAHRALLIHYSTDYVFDGRKQSPWVEEDSPCPLNVYGVTKLAGEQGVLRSGGASFIFRTSWVFGTEGSNFVRTMLRLGSERQELSVVADQIGAPTWSRSLAQLALHTVQSLTSDEGIDFEAAKSKAGLYHATCGGCTNWHEFAAAIFETAAELGMKLRVNSLVPIASAEYVAAAERPKYSVLSNEKLNRTLGYGLPHWREALGLVMRELVNTAVAP